jgi:hypothetical protein
MDIVTANVVRQFPSIWAVLVLVIGCLEVRAGAPLEAGFLAHEYAPVIDGGSRTEVLGPIISWETNQDHSSWQISPLMSREKDLDGEAEQFDFLYPVLTYRRYGQDSRFQFFQVLNFVNSSGATETNAHRFSVFPFYLQQRSADTNLNYTSVLPFYGHVEHRLSRDEVSFIMFPAYLESRKGSMRTRNYLFPFFHLRDGNELKGWQLWPVCGSEVKGLTYRTNSVEEVEPVGGYEKRFILWPIYLRQKTGLGTTNEGDVIAFLPAYSRLRSPDRDSTSIVWPLFTSTEDRQKHYREWDCPWPLVVFARGEGKTGNRVWPFYSHFSNTNLRSRFLLWPLFKSNGYRTAYVERDRYRIMFFLYSERVERQIESGKTRKRWDVWPLFYSRRDYDGKTRFQALAVLEPFWPENRPIQRCYAPIWALWRSEKDPNLHRSSHSVLWNLARWESDQDGKKGSFLFGLIRYHASPDGTRWRLFYLPAFVKGGGGSISPPKS